MPPRCPRKRSFRQGLRDLGWVEGQTIAIEYRYADGKLDRLPDLAADLVRLKVDVIVTSVTSDALAAQKATRTIPIVMAAVGDPVASGLVASLARPGGNITGSSQVGPDLVGKRLELLKEIVPKLSSVAVLANPQGAASILNWKEMQLPARQLGVQLHALEVRSAEDYEKTFEDAIRTRAGALYHSAIAAAPRRQGDRVIIRRSMRTDAAPRGRLPALRLTAPLLQLFLEPDFDQRLIRHVPSVCGRLDGIEQMGGQAQRLVCVDGFRLGNTVRTDFAASKYSVVSCVLQNLRSAASDLNAGTGLSFLLIMCPFLAVHVSRGNHANQRPSARTVKMIAKRRPSNVYYHDIRHADHSERRSCRSFTDKVIE